MDITLINYMEEQLRLTPTEFKRYKYRELPWEARLVGLMGPRGVGKSTMVLQHIKEQDEETRRRSIYVSITAISSHIRWRKRRTVLCAKEACGCISTRCINTTSGR